MDTVSEFAPTLPLARSLVDLLVFDFDGVLTDNRVLVLQDGTEAVICNRADGLAFDILRQARIPALIMSTETNPVVAARARKLKVPVEFGLADKGAALRAVCERHAADPARVMFIGNDVNDLPALRAVGFPIAVADAHPAVKAAAWHILETRGGDGVARELVERVLDLGLSW